MLSHKSPGFHFFSNGLAWEEAYQQAAEFLAAERGLLLLGPGVGEGGQSWLKEKSFKENPIRFGSHTQLWDEWIKSLARERALSQGQGFRVFNRSSKREYLRQILEILSQSEVFHHLGGIWREEKFFAALQDCVEEARLAGLFEESAIARAQDLLLKGDDPVARAAYEDFWHLLLTYERGLAAQESAHHDKASQILLAKEADHKNLNAIFLLGFDHLCLLETDFLQNLAREIPIYLPLGLDAEEIDQICEGKSETPQTNAALSLQGLLTGFTGNWFNHSKSKPSGQAQRHFFLQAHTPREELRAASAMANFSLLHKKEIRFVLDPNLLEEAQEILREELSLPYAPVAHRALAHPVAQVFFQALLLKEKNYELAYGVEFARLLQFTNKDFYSLPVLATRAGIRKGLGDWQRKAERFEEEELLRFAALLRQLDEIFPAKAHAAVFAEKIDEFAALIGIAELAHRAPDLEREREAHGALAAILRNAQMLAATTTSIFTYAEWARELRILLENTFIGSGYSYFPSLQFYQHGEWLPPAEGESLTLVLGFQASVGPRQAFNFYLEESARRKLSDLLLPTQVQNEMAFLRSMKKIHSQENVIFSHAKFDLSGKENSKSWISDALLLSEGEWPEVPPLREQPSGEENLVGVHVSGAQIKNYSASLFESYKTCPFQAFARKLLRLEDKIQDSALDVSRLDEGSIVHRALELFYQQKNGKDLLDTAERNAAIEDCLDSAVREQRIEFYKGSDELLRLQVRRLLDLLVKFVESDIQNYTAFPYFRKPDTEVKVEGLIAGKYPWTGKIDRVDVDEKNKNFLVLDYKIGSSTPSSKEVQELDRFQLQLYIEGAQALYPGFTPLGGLYVSLKTGKRNQGFVNAQFNESKKNTEPGPRYYKLDGRNASLLTQENFDQLRERTKAELVHLATEISRGDFPIRPSDEELSCKRCEVRPACRIRGIQAPPSQPWVREDLSKTFEKIQNRQFLASPTAQKKEKRFNPEQNEALDKRGSLVLVEASAGTGKTTVIVEKIHRFLTEKIQQEPVFRAVERFVAISFTEKSTQELADRLSVSLLDDPKMGSNAAALARRQISTIHGFCRKIIADFPVEAGVSPMAQMLDAKEAEKKKREVLEDFFLHPHEQDAPALDLLYAEYPRHKLEKILGDLLDKRDLWKNDLAEYEKLLQAGEESAALPAELLTRDLLKALLSLHKRLLDLYARKKKEFDFLDFSDLEALALKVLDHPHAREYYQKRFSLILVDEFQDTNTIQRDILDKIAHQNGDNLFLVGDAKQSIYRFRNADVSVFQTLRAVAEKKNNLVQLHRNYRSRKEIVEVANKISATMFPAESSQAPAYEAFASPSTAHKEPGGRVQILRYGAPDEKLLASERKSQEAQIVVSLIQRLAGEGKSYGKMAILLRKVAGNEIYLKALTQAGIPFRIGASRGFFTQQVILDGLSLLRSLTEENNDLAMLAVLRSPWVKLADERIYELQKKNGGCLSEKVSDIDAPFWLRMKKLATHVSLARILEISYQNYPLGRREHFQTEKMIALVRDLEKSGRTKFETVHELSSWAGWESEEEASDDSVMPEPESAGAVQILTIHAAKGLEFDTTILPDLDSDLMRATGQLRLLPGIGLSIKREEEEATADFKTLNEENSKRDLAELKRLFYVALTRAKEEQYLLLSNFSKKKNKADTWGEFLRNTDLSGLATFVDLPQTQTEPQSKLSSPAVIPPSARTMHHIPLRFETSISELAAYQFCGEFHRRKFVQVWDDRLVNLWPRPKGAFRKYANNAGAADENKIEVEKWLKSLKIEKKERGIALHRVLERVKGNNFSLFPIWLTEAYEAQGVDISKANFAKLLERDLSLLRSFLESSLGQELFTEKNKAYPEIPFEWQLQGNVLHGTIDRLICNTRGEWIVVDYKSSILEESLQRYEFQVGSYVAAVARSQLAKGNKNPVVKGYLVDLFTAESYPVAMPAQEAEVVLVNEIQHARGNYTLTDFDVSPSIRGIVGGNHCFSCAYSMHCDVGAKFVLGFK